MNFKIAGKNTLFFNIQLFFEKVRKKTKRGWQVTKNAVMNQFLTKPSGQWSEKQFETYGKPWCPGHLNKNYFIDN
ncbi:MAG: hypothetical protein II865_06285 [Bacteroidales bacterium]|nr:hypothetical protein [Bacteroidales bacterium]